jgi:ribosomal protein S12 methylthiotransferase
VGKSVHVISLGCPKNRVDSEAMIGQLGAEGYRLTADPLRADVVVVNTCGFLRASVDEALAEIAALALLKRKREFQLVVAGCLVQRMGERLRRQAPAIDALVGVHSCDRLMAAIEGGRGIVERGPTDYGGDYYGRRALTTGPGWAYLRIADGCDNRCGYCLIPSIRGRFRSRPVGELVAEARSLAARGVRELDLIAQDTTDYGVDLGGTRLLPRLLRRLDAVDGIEWIRVLYTHPAHLDDRAIAAVAGLPKVVKYLDVPLQHVSDRILKAQRRRIDGAGTRALIARLRERIPGLALRTTFITGLPGETDAEFEALLEFVRDARFEKLGAFAFSPEPGTRAARMKGQVPAGVARERQDELMRLQRKISAAAGRARIGTTCRVLVDAAGAAGTPRRAGYHSTGRSAAEAPEVDGAVFIRSKRRLTAGDFVPVRIGCSWEYDVGGTAV